MSKFDSLGFFLLNNILHLRYIQTLSWRAEPTGATVTVDAHSITCDRTAPFHDKLHPHYIVNWQ